MRVVDLFSGCGGMSAGFEAAGHEIVMAAEKWSAARGVYNLNFDHSAQDIDLSDVVEAVRHTNRARPDIIVGGPPCQDFSMAGLRIEADKADLTRSFAEIVNAALPTWFVMENVAAARESLAFIDAKTMMADAGYGITETILDSSYYGVPQFRKRLFLIGRLETDDGFLIPELTDDAAADSLTVRQYLGDELGVEYYYSHPRHWGRRAVYSLDEPAATIRSANRPIPPKYTSHKLDAAPLEGIKPLTSEQRARIQTFHRDFRFEGYKSNIDLMVANAVPVNLARHVGEAIMRFEESRQVRPSEAIFRIWLHDTHGYTPRTAGNVLCRLRRAQKMLPLRHYIDIRDAVHDLQKNPEFLGLTSAVRSQLKKALDLHHEFCANMT
jgi:DNA (cytosine-5)-methyltransferase 1